MNRNKQIDVALTLYTEEAHRLESLAAGIGSHTDGGCSRMLGEVAAYKCGRSGSIPAWLEPYMAEAAHRMDPEYTTYLRLKKKFEKF